MIKMFRSWVQEDDFNWEGTGGGGGGGGGGGSFYDTMTLETRSVLIDRRSKKFHLSFALPNSLGIACKSALSLCFQIYA